LKKYYYILFSLILTLYSCTVDEQCRQNRYVNLSIGFYHVKKVQNTISKASLNIDSLTIRGLRFDSLKNIFILQDSVLYNNSKALNKINLPLHKFLTISKYQIRLNASVDTLTVLHTNTDEYLSLECGCIKTHSIDTVLITNHFIDSIRISNHNVNTSNVENIQLYK